LQALGAATVQVVDTSTDDLDSFRAAFYLISFLVLAVGFVNLLGPTLLGIPERTPDPRTPKTHSLTPRPTAPRRGPRGPTPTGRLRLRAATCPAPAASPPKSWRSSRAEP